MIRIMSVAVLWLGLLAGCGGDSPPADPNADAQKPPAEAPPKPAEASPSNTVATNQGQTKTSAPVPTFQPLDLTSPGGSSSSSTPQKVATKKDQLNSVLDAMKPLQIFLGQWNTTTRTQGAGSATWVWDFQTDKTQPALVMSTKDHPYFENVRLTFLKDEQKFQLTAEDQEKQTRIYQGEFTEEPHFITGDSGKPEPRFEMMLTEVGNDSARKLVGVQLSQRDKNRMWMQVFQRSGKNLRIQDTVANQRDGTSFAVSDTDYGDRECIVSQGLGTTTVSFMGRTYYVCCSGCQAAFNDDPKFWITKAEERDAENNK